MKGVKKTSLFALFLHLGLHESYALISLRPRGRNIPCRGSLEVVPKSRANDRYSISEYNFDRTKRSPRKRPHGRRRAPGFSHEKKVARQRPAWLQQATENILATKPGSLNKGKWHELTSMIKAWSKFSKDDVEAPIVIEKLLKRLLDERKAGVDEAKADIRLYNILLDAWACSAIFRTRVPEIASQRAREILVLLQENFEREKDLDIQPNEESFALVFHVVCKMEGPVKARRVLAWMEYIYKVERNIYAKPTKKHYFTLLNTYANSRDGNAGKLVEGFIRHMKMMGVSPDTFCYNIAIKAWMKAKRGRESAEHADRILEEMDVPKDLVTYSTVISAWAASGMKSHAVSRAEELLRDIEESEDLEPNTVVLNTVMSTWVKSRNPGAVNRTEELLRRMESSESCPPDLISYNTHIHSLSIHAKRDGYAQRAHNLLISLEDRYKKKQISYRPNLFTYNLVIDAWSRSQDYDAAWNAVKVLRKLIDEDGPNPDTFSFNQVLSALSRSSKPGAARLAERLLDYMEDAYKMKMYRDAKPDVIGYTSVIITLGRSGEGDAAERAEKILERMKAGYAVGETYMKPNRMTYNSLIDCWAKSGQGTFAARKAEALLKEMDEMAMRDSSIAPNIITYNAVLNSWARSGTRCCGNKAEEYLDRMWELHNGGDGNMAPNGFSFNTVRFLCERGGGGEFLFLIF